MARIMARIMVIWPNRVRIVRPGQDNSPMGLTTGLSVQARRLPGRLEDLHGPWQGIVVLPVHLSWHQLREFDVAKQEPRLLLYSIVISQGRRNDIARFLNAQRLLQDWPQLRPLVSNKMRRALERRLGLRLPSAHDKGTQDEGAHDEGAQDGGTGTPLRMPG
jgi:hypothetical protein